MNEKYIWRLHESFDAQNIVATLSLSMALITTEMETKFFHLYEITLLLVQNYWNRYIYLKGAPQYFCQYSVF